jgi:hypothetical protein
MAFVAVLGLLVLSKADTSNVWFQGLAWGPVWMMVGALAYRHRTAPRVDEESRSPGS